MWNIYVFGLLFLYAPSHKQWSSGQDEDDSAVTGDDHATGEEIEFSMHRGASSEASELSSLTEFMRHQATD